MLNKKYIYSLRTGAHALLDVLVQNNVQILFGYPGGAILPLYDELYKWEKASIIKHILVRHEQSAAHGADAYARSTKKVGVCIATSGPGATNLVTGIATAKMDSIPLIIITGQVTRSFIGTDAFQETDIFGITLPIVKHSYTIHDTTLIPKIIREALFLCQNGRPGPILIDIPKDVGLEEISKYFYIKASELFLNNNYRVDHITNASIFFKVLKQLNQSYQPLLYIGGGVLRSRALKVIRQLAKLFQIPLATTLMGKSACNNSDHICLGMLGMHGTVYANFAVSECDLLMALGARFDDRVTGKLDEFACDAEVLHIDIDATEISKNRNPQLSIIGDIRKVLLQILRRIRQSTTFGERQTDYWLKRVQIWRDSYPLIKKRDRLDLLLPQEAISIIGEFYKKSFVTTDVGQHQMWAAQLINCEPKKWVSSAGLGTMGFGLPAAIGTKIGNINQDVICISGDSSFQMSIQELSTISQYNLGIKIFIINNNWQGMVRQWQEGFYGGRFSNSYMKNGMPQFAEIAKAYGLSGYMVYNASDLKRVLMHISSELCAAIVDINVADIENCYPMVIPSRSNSQMIGFIK